MSLLVSIPVTLRVDAESLDAGSDRLDAALRQALSQAAEGVVRELGDRGDYLRLDLQPPRFTWTGDGVKAVAADLRQLGEACVSTAIKEVVPPILHRPQSSPPEVLPMGGGAALDPDRDLGVGYVLSSYDTSPDKRARPSNEVVYLQNRPQLGLSFAPGTVARWYRYVGEKALRSAARSGLKSAIAQGAKFSAGRLGFVYAGAMPNGNTGLWVAVAQYDGTEGSIKAFDKSVIGGFDGMDLDEGKLSTKEIKGYGYYGVGQISKLGSGSATEELTKKLLVDHDADFRSRLARANKKLGAKLSLDAPDVRKLYDKERGLIEAFVKKRVASLAALNAGKAMTAAQLVDGRGGEYLGAFADIFGGTSSVRLIPLAAVNYEPDYKPADIGGDEGGAGGKDKDGEGGKGGSGAKGKKKGGGGDGDAGSGGEQGGAGGDKDGAGGGRPPPPPVFPNPGGGDPVELSFDPLEGEASLDDLGKDADRLRWLMKRIAWRLNMPMGDYPGAFLVAAAKVWGARAAGISGFEAQRSATLRRTEGMEGSLGDVDFKPQKSPAIDILRHLGTTTVTMSALRDALYDIYQNKTHAAKIKGTWSGNGTGWALQLFKAYTPTIHDSIGLGYKVACKTCLIQLCLASRQEILIRRNNIDSYFPLFDGLLQGLMAPQARLQSLRNTLMAYMHEYAPSLQTHVSTHYDTWKGARRDLAAMFRTSASAMTYEESAEKHGTLGKSGVIVPIKPKGYGIKDETGRIWTLQELDQAMALRKGTAQAIDPMVEKIADLPQAVIMSKSDPKMAKRLLRETLDEMLSNNTDVLNKAQGGSQYAFRASKIREDINKRTVPYTSYALGGVHLLAHEAIGDSFLGDRSYAGALNHVFGVELGTQGLLSFFEFTGVFLLSVICPPLGAVAGLILGGVHLYQAHEQMKIPGGLFNSAAVLKTSDAELDLFLAELETAFALIPFAGKILKAGGRAASGFVRSGARGAARSAARGLSDDIAKEMAEQLKNGLAHAFIRELASDQMIGKIIQAGITPVIQQLHAELTRLEGAPARPSLAAPKPRGPAEQQRDSIEVKRALDEEGDADKARSDGADKAKGE